MRRKKLIKTIAAALVFVSLSAISPLTNDEFGGLVGLQSAEAATGTVTLNSVTYTIDYTANTASVTSIPAAAGTNVTIPSTVNGYPVVTVGTSAAAINTTLVTLTLPDSITAINYGAFYGCTAMTSIYIPDTVTTIADQVFNGCTKLTNLFTVGGLKYVKLGTNNCFVYNQQTAISGAVTIPSTANGYNVTGCVGYAFVSYSSTSYLNSVPTGSTYTSSSVTTSITFPSTFVSIGASSCYTLTGLTTVTLPDSITTIGASAFYGCSALSTLTMNSTNNVTYVGASAFSNDSKLSSFPFTDKLTYIGASAFNYCVLLPSQALTLPNLTYLGASAFNADTWLTSINAPCVTGVGDSAFYNCTGLTSATFSSALTSLGTSSFYGCTALTSISSMPNLATFYNTSFSGCTKLQSISTGLTALGQTAPTNYYKVYFMDEDEATILGTWWALSGASLASKQPVPTKTGYTFNKWTKTSSSAASVVGNIQENVTFIASYTEGSITVPDPTVAVSSSNAVNRDSTVTATIGNMQSDYSYYYTLDGTAPTTTNGTLITGSTINIPSQNTDSQTTVTVKVVATKSGVYSNVASDSVTYAAGTATSTTTATQNGVTYTLNADNTATIKSVSGLSGAVTIPSTIVDSGTTYTITGVGIGAFKNATGITSITLPSTLTTVGANAFQGCTGLTSVSIPSSVTALNGGTFSGCTGLTTLTLPDSITTLNSSDFTGCTNLKYLTGNSDALGSVSISGMYRVYFIDSDESTILGTWIVKAGASMVGKQPTPTLANYTFSKWTKYNTASSSILGNIQDNVSFEAVYTYTPGTTAGKLATPVLTPSTTNPSNRTKGVTITIS